MLALVQNAYYYCLACEVHYSFYPVKVRFSASNFIFDLRMVELGTLQTCHHTQDPVK